MARRRIGEGARGMAMQRAWVMDAAGGLAGLRIADAPLPEPGPGEVRIAVHAVGLNRHDLGFIARDGWGDAWPRVPGTDVAGRIEALGPGVDGWRKGTLVMCLLDPRRGGGLADFALAPAAALAPVPRGVAATDAAALPSPCFAAFHAVERRLALRDGQAVVVFGASGGVGGFAVQFAAARRARVIAVHSGHAREQVLALGAREALDRDAGDVALAIRALTDGRGADAVIDVVGRAHATRALGLLRVDGAMACVAGLPALSGRPPMAGAVTIHEVSPAACHRAGDPARLRDLSVVGRAILRRVANGNLDPLLREVVAFDAVPAALARVASGAARGRIVVRLRA
jgi:NADPH:quinone reductase-like Zn-dependent oxidoreductase